MRAPVFLPLRFVNRCAGRDGLASGWRAAAVRAREQPRWQPYADDAVTGPGGTAGLSSIDFFFFFAVWSPPVASSIAAPTANPRVLRLLWIAPCRWPGHGLATRACP